MLAQVNEELANFCPLAVGRTTTSAVHTVECRWPQGGGSELIMA